MEFIIIATTILIAMVVLKFVFNYNQKQLKHIAEDKELNNLAKKYPSNKEMCRDYLRKLKNEDVAIEEKEGAKASLYIAITNKIIIANIQDSYTRIQTIAHECLHSIQSRKLLMFNFFYANIYLIYFVVICMMQILKILPYKMMFLVVFLIMSTIYYMVRVYLENDAMIKARYLAEEYMEEKNISSTEERQKLIKGFDKINKVGIQSINYLFFKEIMIKAFIFTILCVLF